MQASRYYPASILCAVVLLFLSFGSAIEPKIGMEPFATSPNKNIFNEIAVSSIITVFAAGLLAGFNPCLLAMLAFLATTMLASTCRRKDILTMVAFFSLGTFAIYIIFGLGLFSILQERSTVAIFRFALVAILLILGLLQLEDARRLQAGGTSLFRNDWTKKYVQGVVISQKLSSYFLFGALFALVRAPCVGGIYIAVIGKISHQGYTFAGPLYLVIYIMGIALPMLIIGVIIALGMSPEKLDIFRNKHRVAIRLITGFTLLIMAPIIFLGK